MAQIQLANGFILSNPGQLHQALATAPKLERMISLTALLKEVLNSENEWLEDRNAYNTAKIPPARMFQEIYSIIARVTGDDPEDLAFPF